ncbi:hypothetical protein D3C85_1463420 [compost metagenome]
MVAPFTNEAKPMDDEELRDYFAAKAMQSLMLTEPLDLGDESRGCQIDQTDGITYEAYRMADAMLETRRTYKRKN